MEDFAMEDTFEFGADIAEFGRAEFGDEFADIADAGGDEDAE
jgi:hypothetical protein